MPIRMLLATACFGLSAAGAVAAEVRIGGDYAVTGTNFNGSHYGGTVSIVTGADSPCRITWNTGGSGSVGFCMRDQDSLAAAYQLGNDIGLVIYHIQPDGTLVGHWSVADKPGVGTEILVPKGRTPG